MIERSVGKLLISAIALMTSAPSIAWGGNVDISEFTNWLLEDGQIELNACREEASTEDQDIEPACWD